METDAVLKRSVASGTLEREIERCHHEIAEVERLLGDGHPDVHGLCLASRIGRQSYGLLGEQKQDRRRIVEPGGGVGGEAGARRYLAIL